MMHRINLKQLFKKEISTICISIGGFYTVFGIFSLMMVKMQTIMLSNFNSPPPEFFRNALNMLHETWIIFMPLLSFLGIGYLAFGFFFNKITANKYYINLIFSLFCFAWVIAYSISCVKYIDIFFAEIANDFGAFKYIGYGFTGFGFIVLLTIMTIPQYLIGKKIKEQEILNKK